MVDMLPGLKGLKGGDKQEWNNANLDLIAMVNDTFGFDTAQKMFNMKADTLISCLRRAEGHHRPVITEAHKAMALARGVAGNLSDVQKEQSVQADALAGVYDEVGELKGNLVRYFELIARASQMMAELCQTRNNNFTEHIRKPNKRKVGLTTPGSRVRLSHFPGQVKQLPGPRAVLPRHKGHYPKRGWPSV